MLYLFDGDGRCFPFCMLNIENKVLAENRKKQLYLESKGINEEFFIPTLINWWKQCLVPLCTSNRYFSTWEVPTLVLSLLVWLSLTWESLSIYQCLKIICGSRTGAEMKKLVKPTYSLGEVTTSSSTHVSTQVRQCYLMLLLQPHCFILQISLKSYSQKVIWESKYLLKMYNYLLKVSITFS